MRAVRHLSFAFISLLAFTSYAAADTTPQTLPFSQNWTNTGLITANDNWSGVPGVTGFLGQDITTATAVDPQTLVTESAVANDLSVLANQGAATSTSGDVGEFEIADPVVGLQGSGTADVPYILITLNTTGVPSVRVAYNVRDIDAAADNAVQPVALQYRIGTSGNFTNVPAAFIADATTGPSLATLVTPVNVLLPSNAGNQAIVQVRIVTSNAVGSDEWVGIDDISITGDPTPPTAAGMTSPASQIRSGAVTLTAAVTNGTFPTSTGVTVTCDVSSIGGSTTQSLFDDATNGDGLAGDNVFTFATTVGAGAALGAKTFPCTVADAQTRSSMFNITFNVIAVCGDGAIEGAETCDDGQSTPTSGDGCSATCTIESGWTCTGTPSTCTDIDECTSNTDNCDANATCNNMVGSFSCTCNAGFSGNGVTCTDIDECSANSDNCDANAVCANTVGSFSCTCNMGFSGNGVTCTDIDECTLNTDDCVAAATCSNTVGAYSCSCPTGFGGDGHTSGTGCTDLNECTLNTDNCATNATCTNTVGSFTCACNAGYSGNGVTCADINECTANTDDCVAAATCNNTVGAYTCACPTGYTGDGKTSGTACTDLNECITNTDNCDAHAMCTNTVGSFTCACNTGFTGNGVTCTDTDECAANTDNCDTNATCTNTPGTFTCACNAGFSGNGTSCAPNCGDGQLIAPEACDDGDMTSGDGCSMNCEVEAGYACTGTPSTCATVCGDGLKVAGESCDDGNTDADDGCDAQCGVEDGWTCLGSPSTCEPPADGGCCSSSTHPGSVALLAMLVIVGLRRRQRR